MPSPGQSKFYRFAIDPLLLLVILCITFGSCGETENSGEGVPGDNPPPLLPVDPDLPLEEVLCVQSPGELDRFGSALASAGPILAVGIPGLNTVQIFLRDAAGAYLLSQVLTLPAFLDGVQDGFGNALAMTQSADRLLVGTMREDYSADPPTENFTGRVLLYEATATGYQFRHELLPASGQKTFGRFGQSIAIVANVLIAISEEQERQIHIFEYNSATGAFPSSSSYVVNPVNTGMVPNSTWETSFGTAVAAQLVDGQPLIGVGAQDAHIYPGTFDLAPDETTPNSYGATAARTGTVVILKKIAGQYQMVQYLVPEKLKTKNMGYSLIMRGKRLAVGAIYSKVYVPEESGSAMVWDLGADNKYVRLGRVSGPEEFSMSDARFGLAVDLCGVNNEYLIVGRPGRFGSDEGRVFVYRINGPDDIVLEQHFTGSSGNPAPSVFDLSDHFGFALTCNDYGDVFVGAPFSNDFDKPGNKYDGSKVYWFK